MPFLRPAGLCIGTFIDAGLFGAPTMLVVGLVPGMPLLYDETLHGLAEPLQVDLSDVLGGLLAFGVLALAFWLLTAMLRSSPRMRSQRARRACGGTRRPCGSPRPRPRLRGTRIR